MLTRRIRRVVAFSAMLGLVFAQLAMSAHACALQGSAAPHAATGSAMHAAADHPCSGMAPEPASPQGNACEVHCTDGATLPASPDLPVVALAALPAAAVPLAVLAANDIVARTPYAALPGAPPLNLQFCRLLI